MRRVKAGIVLLCMSLWWVIPFFVVHLVVYPLLAHFRSHLLYVVIIFFSLLFAVTLGFADRKRGLWERYGYWRRYLLLCGTYLLQTAVVLAVLLTLDSRGLLGYFGGDAGGSIGMLLIPSVVIYLLIGAVAGGITELIKRSGKHHGQDIFV
ncbi:MAG TPA: hypothetical protein PLR60_14955 [Syntrophorhabdaceae bacterium]|nr:hypothetical protein [Syntrophorhabdaceae bacterium]